ncbi:MAG: hypothetical protein US69_C0002G0017 [candidate division TM6 bacterium GW2011_GWF2_38_10]|nr:MAG: hypothetical protein US69_C0002G0017 [candidate division TM6 bacterium GW2011_GWF2_38_10]
MSMNMHAVFALWKESASWLAWRELRLLLLASLNTFRRALQLMIRYFGWLFALWIVAFLVMTLTDPLFFSNANFESMVFNISSEQAVAGGMPLSALLIAFCEYIFIYAAFLSTRASIEAKDVSYYKRYFLKPFRFLGVQIFVYMIVMIVQGSLQVLIGNWSLIIPALAWSVPFIVGFYALDRETVALWTIVRKGFSFVVWLAPVVLSVTLFTLGISSLMYSLFTGLCGLAAPYFYLWVVVNLLFFFFHTFIISLFMYAVYSVVYMKMKHAAASLFFT